MVMSSMDSLTARSAFSCNGPVANFSRSGRNMSLCSSSAWEWTSKLGISFILKPMSSLQRRPMRVEWPPPWSPSRRSSLHHSVTVSAANPSSQGFSRVIQPQAYSTARVVGRGSALRMSSGSSPTVLPWFRIRVMWPCSLNSSLITSPYSCCRIFCLTDHTGQFPDTCAQQSRRWRMKCASSRTITWARDRVCLRSK